MASNNDLFAPPSEDELKMFAAPTEEELNQSEPEGPSFLDRLGRSLPGQAAAGLYDLGAGTLEGVQDLGVGLAQGATGGFIDEAAAGARALAEQYLGDDTDAKLAAQGFTGDLQPNLSDKYGSALQDNRQIMKDIAERSPVMNTAGELAGAIGTGIATGGAMGAGKAATAGARALKAGAAGALEGAVSGLGTSEGSLLGNEDQKNQVLKDVALNTVAGGALGGAGQKAGEIAGDAFGKAAKFVGDKADSLIKDSDYLQSIKKSYEIGKDKLELNPSNRLKELQPGHQTPSKVYAQKVEGISNKIMKADSDLSTAVGKSLEDASAKGQKLMFSPGIKDASKNIAKAAGEYNVHFGTLENLDDPVAVKRLLNNVDQGIRDLGKESSAESAATLRQLIEFRRGLSTELKAQVDGYKVAAANLENFRKNIQENVISGGVPDQFQDKFFSEMNNGPGKFHQALQSNVIEPLFANKKNQEVTPLLQKAAMYLESAPPAVKAQLGNLQDEIVDAARLSDVLTKAGTKPSLTTSTSTVGGSVKEGLMNQGQQQIITQANRIGMGTSPVNKVVDMSKKIFNAPKDRLYKIADQLEAKGARKYADSLRKGLDTDNKPMQNAALFIMLQNPETRKLLSGEDNEMAE